MGTPCMRSRDFELEPAHASAETLSQFVEWASLGGNTHSQELLRLLGFDVLELAIRICVRKEGTVRAEPEGGACQVVTWTGPRWTPNFSRGIAEEARRPGRESRRTASSAYEFNGWYNDYLKNEIRK